MPYLSFEIDKLTNCTEDKKTGVVHKTMQSLLTPLEVKCILKKDGWKFNWKTAYKNANHQIFKLQIVNDPQIQGLISLQPLADQQYIELHLIETAPHNFGSKKQYVGVPGNLVAFACKMSFELGFEGIVAFTAKSRLVDHYRQTLGAQTLYGNNRMVILSSKQNF